MNELVLLANIGVWKLRKYWNKLQVGVVLQYNGTIFSLWLKTWNNQKLYTMNWTYPRTMDVSIPSCHLFLDAVKGCRCLKAIMYGVMVCDWTRCYSYKFTYRRSWVWFLSRYTKQCHYFLTDCPINWQSWFIFYIIYVLYYLLICSNLSRSNLFHTRNIFLCTAILWQKVQRCILIAI